MRRCIDTIIHDQADGPVPAGEAAAEPVPSSAPETAPAEPADNPLEEPVAQPSTTKRRRSGPEE